MFVVMSALFVSCISFAAKPFTKNGEKTVYELE